MRRDFSRTFRLPQHFREAGFHPLEVAPRIRPTSGSVYPSSARGWTHLRPLSSEKTSYNSEYHGEEPEGIQLPTCNVLTKTPEGVFHFCATEVLWAPVEGHARHIDLLWPIWNYFDLTPEGRGTDWLPRLS